MMNITVAKGLEKSSLRDSYTSPGRTGQRFLQLNVIHCFELFEARDA
ncbi:MAG: hypothetical protein AB9903_01910 [Vulcanimicrobiota bacterium]